MFKSFKLPITVTRSIELLGLCLIGMLLHFGRDIIMPIIFSFFVSLLLLPIFRWLRKKGVGEILAIVLCILLALLVMGAIVFFVGFQIAGVVKEYPTLEKNIKIHFTTLSTWISQHSSYSPGEQYQWVMSRWQSFVANIGTYLKNVAGSASNVLVFFGLMPIYVFLMLFYKNLLLRFAFLWFKQDNHDKVEESLRETEVIIKSYLVGLLIQVAYITVSLGGILLIFGIKHALLIGIIFAILNLIPYIGALIGNIIGVLLTLSSSSQLWHIFLVLGVIALVQFVDNNIMMPRIVGAKIRINALATILGVVIGGALAGVAGMFLSLPVIAILKIIFDNSAKFKHWGMVLGAERPGLSPMTNYAVRKRKVEPEEEE